jgi:hypothetical protein
MNLVFVSTTNCSRLQEVFNKSVIERLERFFITIIGRLPKGLVYLGMMIVCAHLSCKSFIPDCTSLYRVLIMIKPHSVQICKAHLAIPSCPSTQFFLLYLLILKSFSVSCKFLYIDLISIALITTCRRWICYLVLIPILHCN